MRHDARPHSNPNDLPMFSARRLRFCYKSPKSEAHFAKCMGEAELVAVFWLRISAFKRGILRAENASAMRVQTKGEEEVRGAGTPDRQALVGLTSE